MGAELQAWDGLWHAVLPGRRVRVVVVRRPGTGGPTRGGQRKAPPPVAALGTTARSLSPEDIVTADHARWAVEMAIRDANAFAGGGPEPCRTRERILGANT